MKTFAYLSFFLLPLGLFAQHHATLNVQVFDAQTNAFLDKVHISSRFALNKGKNITTDFVGRANLIPVVGDTITFDHAKYYHLHVVLHDHAPHDFEHPLKVYLTPLHPAHQKASNSHFDNTTHSLHHFEPQQAHHHALKIGVIEDTRASEHRKSWVATPRSESKDFQLIDIHLRTKKQ